MNNDIQKVLIGALIGFMFALLKEKYSYALQLNRLRKALALTLEETVINRLQALVKDNKTTINVLRQDYKKTILGGALINTDQLPMLNSDLIKSISHSELVNICRDKDIYLNISSSAYVIDFLKKGLSDVLLTRYCHNVTTHLREKGITPEQTEAHLTTCPYTKEQSQICVANLQNRISIAEKTIESLQENIAELTKGRFWILKYMF